MCSVVSSNVYQRPNSAELRLILFDDVCRRYHEAVQRSAGRTFECDLHAQSIHVRHTIGLCAEDSIRGVYQSLELELKGLRGVYSTAWIFG